MSEATKTPRRSLTEVVTTRVKPLERLALEQAAEAGNTTVSRVARAAILRGLNQTGKKAAE